MAKRTTVPEDPALAGIFTDPANLAAFREVIQAKKYRDHVPLDNQVELARWVLGRTEEEFYRKHDRAEWIRFWLIDSINTARRQEREKLAKQREQAERDDPWLKWQRLNEELEKAVQKLFKAGAALAAFKEVYPGNHYTDKWGNHPFVSFGLTNTCTFRMALASIDGVLLQLPEAGEGRKFTGVKQKPSQKPKVTGRYREVPDQWEARCKRYSSAVAKIAITAHEMNRLLEQYPERGFRYSGGDLHVLRNLLYQLGTRSSR